MLFVTNNFCDKTSKGYDTMTRNHFCGSTCPGLHYITLKLNKKNLSFRWV